MLIDERSLMAYLAGVHTALLRMGVLVYPSAVLEDVKAAVFRAATCELRTAVLAALPDDDRPVRVVEIGGHLEVAMDRFDPPQPGRLYR